MELWLIYAIGAAVFAAITNILAKIGVKDVDSNLATAIRTMVVVVFAWLMVYIVGSYDTIHYVSGRTWVFLVLSGLCTGGAWLCFFRALKMTSVNKVVPMKKSSTILTMILAFIFLGEPVGLFTVVGMGLMGVGTWLMLKTKRGESSEAKEKSWLFFAVLAAIFASLTAIFSRVGVAEIDATLWTALRTMIVVPLSWVMVVVNRGETSTRHKMHSITRKSWIFLVLSGMATGFSWLFFYHALQIGQASHVVPIDRLSIVLVMVFARLFLGERFSRRSLLGLGLVTAGTLIATFVGV